jgi:predicted nucleotidyltransferase
MTKRRELPDNAAQAVQEMVPLLKQLVRGRYAISLGGSFGKGRFDERSDLDVRLFFDEYAKPWHELAGLRGELEAIIAAWAERGLFIDGYWPRRIADIEAELALWISGDVTPTDFVWTLWGYQMPTDLTNQWIIEDPFGIIAGWQERLRAYPPALKRAILDKNLASARYWRSDYHYESKAVRGDPVFCVGVASRVVHNLIQILFAVNEVYYVGDGWNLDYVRGFEIAPPDFAAKAETVLLPEAGGRRFEVQRERLGALVDEMDRIVESLGLP